MMETHLLGGLGEPCAIYLLGLFSINGGTLFLGKILLTFQCHSQISLCFEGGCYPHFDDSSFNMRSQIVRSDPRKRSAEPTNRCADRIANKGLSHIVPGSKLVGREKCVARPPNLENIGLMNFDNLAVGVVEKNLMPSRNRPAAVIRIADS